MEDYPITEQHMKKRAYSDSSSSEEEKSPSSEENNSTSDNVSIYDYMSDKIRSTFEKLGKYEFTDPPSELFETRPIFYLHNGDIYEGQWNPETKEPEGQGVYIRAKDNKLYEGYFRLGELNGHGRAIEENGNVYVGIWEDNLMHDNGLYTWGGVTKWAGHSYQGDYHYGIRDGYGVYTWPDGSKYSGNWTNGVSSGKGVKIWTDGRKYDGQNIVFKMKHASDIISLLREATEDEIAHGHVHGPGGVHH